jgi:hypothetical protein
VVGASPRLGDDVRSLLQDLVIRNAGTSVLRSATLGDEAPSPRSSSADDPRISELWLLGSLGSLPPPINWRRVGDEAESTCS